MAVAELPTLAFSSAHAWDQWLTENHVNSRGIWLKYSKKGSGIRSITYDEAVEVALCYGWIDGQARALDESFWLQRFTPRGKRSSWSRKNRDRVLALIAADRIRPAGLAEVERAKSDGRWARAYEPPSTATVPDDLQRELEQRPRAAAFFATLDSTNRYAILYRLQDAKRPETRARRLAQFVEMLEEERAIYPVRAKKEH